jgi:hypothetical protein
MAERRPNNSDCTAEVEAPASNEKWGVGIGRRTEPALALIIILGLLMGKSKGALPLESWVGSEGPRVKEGLVGFMDLGRGSLEPKELDWVLGKELGPGSFGPLPSKSSSSRCKPLRQYSISTCNFSTSS